jgi:hypothetical protein
MVVARACKLSLQNGHRTSRASGSSAKVSHTFVHHADTVIQYAPDLIESVTVGTTPLNEAYDEARRRKAGRFRFSARSIAACLARIR